MFKKLFILLVFIPSLLVGREHVVRDGTIYTLSDTITCKLDISSDFNYAIYYKKDPKKWFFKKIKSTDVVKIVYENKIFDRLPVGDKGLLALLLVDGDLKLYSDFLPSITPGNNFSMNSAHQTSKTMRIYYLVGEDFMYELTPKNYNDKLKEVLCSRPDIFEKVDGLSYHDMLEFLPDFIHRFNRN